MPMQHIGARETYNHNQVRAMRTALPKGKKIRGVMFGGANLLSSSAMPASLACTPLEPMGGAARAGDYGMVL